MGTALFPQTFWEQLFPQFCRNSILGVPIDNQYVKGGGLLYGGFYRLWEQKIGSLLVVELDNTKNSITIFITCCGQTDIGTYRAEH